MEKFKFKYNDKEYSCYYAKTNADYEKLVDYLEVTKKRILGLDIETGKRELYQSNKRAGLSPQLSYIRLIQIFDGEKIFIFDKGVEEAQSNANKGWERLKAYLSNPKIKFVAHYAIFEIKHLIYNGVEPYFHCSMILAQFLETSEHSPFEIDPEDEHAYKDMKYKNKGGFGLANLMSRYFNIHIPKALQTSNWNDEKLSKEQLLYAAVDAIIPYQLAEYLIPKIKEKKMWNAYLLYRNMQYCIADMEINGLKIDKEKHNELIKEWTKDKKKYELDCKVKFDVKNLRSGKQLSEWVEKNVKDKKTLKKWSKNEKSGTYKFDKATLKEMSVFIPELKSLLEFKKNATLLSTFGDSLQIKMNPATDRVHCSFSLAETRTGRLSSREPNLQNMPSREGNFKHIFVAEEGCSLVYADFSQVEIRVAGELSKDPVIRDAYRKGIDLHKKIVATLENKPIEEVTKEERQIGKACFSGDTEFFSSSGWKRFDSTCSSEVAVWNPDTGKISFEYLDIVSGGYQELYHITDRNIDLLLTGNHNIAYITAYGDVRKFTLEDQSLPCIRHWISAGKYINNPRVTSDFARLVAMVSADGSFEGNFIRLGFTKKRKIVRCRELLYRMGVDYKESINSLGITRFWFKDLIGEVLKYCTTDKVLGWGILDDFPIDDFLDEVSYWDAHRLKSKTRTRILFTTVKEETADVIQACCALTGRQSVKSLRNKSDGKRSACYSVSYREKPQPLSRASFKYSRTNKKEEVFCCETSTGYILVRREGKVSVQGNCNFGLQFGMGWKKLADYAKTSYGVDLTPDESLDLWSAYHNTYQVYSSWCNEQRAKAEKLGFVRTYMGKMRKLEKNEIYTKAINTPVQGSAAEVMFITLKILREDLKGKGKLINTVHDSVIVECKDEYAEEVLQIVYKAMEKGMKFMFKDAPIEGIAEGGIGKSWGDAE